MLIGRAKVAGILLESVGKANGADAASVIVGTGVNIVSSPRATPYPATSLVEQGFAAITPRALLGALSRCARPLAAAMARGGLCRVCGPPGARAAWGSASRIRLRLDREELQAASSTSRPSGALLLDLDGGGRREIAAGDVFYPDPWADPKSMTKPYLLAIDVGNTNTVFALYRERVQQGAMARLHGARPHRRRACRSTDPADGAQGLYPSGRRAPR